MGPGWEVDPTGPWGTGRVCRCRQKHKRTRVDPLTRGPLHIQPHRAFVCSLFPVILNKPTRDHSPVSHILCSHPRPQVKMPTSFLSTDHVLDNHSVLTNVETSHVNASTQSFLAVHQGLLTSEVTRPLSSQSTGGRTTLSLQARWSLELFLLISSWSVPWRTPGP